MKFAGCATASLSLLLLGYATVVDGQESMLAVVGSRPEFTTLASIAGASPEISAYLEDTTTTATLFAPVDAAFAALGNETMTKFTTDPNFSRHLSCILEAHVIDGEKLTTASYVNGTVYPSFQEDNNITIVTDGSSNKVVGEVYTATLIDDKDISASNGVIQTADAVLLPDCAVTPIWEQILANSEFFTTLIEFVERLQLVDVLNNTDNDPTQALTIIAPTDAAFGAVDPTLLATFEEDDALLTNFVTYHLLPGSRFANSLMLIDTSLNGKVMNFDKTANGTVRVNDASTIIEADILAANGVIHIVDDLALVPPTIETFVEDVPEKFTALREALELFSFSFDPTVDLTLLAPNNAAFESVSYPFPLNEAYSPLIVYILFGHVVEGAFNSSEIFANTTAVVNTGGAPVTVDPAAQTLGDVGATVVQADMKVDRNSIVHEIDKVLVPTSVTKTIYQNMAGDPQDRFSLMLSLINATNFTELLNSTNEDGLTVFGSTNDAFDNLENFAPGVTTALQDPKNALFAEAVIAYHIAESNLIVAEDQVPLNVSRSFNLKGDVMFNTFSAVNFQGQTFQAVGVSRLTGEVTGANNGVIQTMVDAILPFSVQEVGSAIQRTRGMDLLLFAPRFGRGSAYDSLYYNVSDPMNVQMWTLILPNNTAFTQDQIEKYAPGNNVWDFHASQILFLHVLPRQYLRSSDFNSTTYQSGGGPVNVTVFPSGDVQVGNTKLVETDFYTWNGVTHISEGFVGPNWIGKTILDMLAEIDDTSTVIDLLNQYPDIVAALNNTNPQNTITMFAPVNSAFEELTTSLGGSLPPAEEVENILLYHVYPTMAFTEFFPLPAELTSLSEVNATFSNSTDGLKLNEATVVSDVILAENGIIYLIDQVLLSEEITTPPTSAPSAAPTTSAPSVGPKPTELPTPASLAPDTPSPTTSGSDKSMIGIALLLMIAITTTSIML